jgi:hypothetical protein
MPLSGRNPNVASRCWAPLKAGVRGHRSVRNLDAIAKRNARITVYVYGAWSLLWIGVALSTVADARVGAHLWLLFTGTPLALLSLYLPHGSLQAIVAAGLLGLIQWVPVIAWWSSGKRHADDL